MEDNNKKEMTPEEMLTITPYFLRIQSLIVEKVMSNRSTSNISRIFASKIIQNVNFRTAKTKLG